VYIGTRYILRAQERVRRKREGLPIDEEDLQSYSNEISRHHHQINRIVGLDFGTLNVRVASSMGSLTQQKPMIRVIESAEGHRSIPAIVSVDHGNATVGQLAKASLGRKNNVAAIAPHLLLGYDEQVSYYDL
jgi:molecular chaperone DnaK (HSP70)